MTRDLVVDAAAVKDVHSGQSLGPSRDARPVGTFIMSMSVCR